MSQWGGTKRFVVRILLGAILFALAINVAIAQQLSSSMSGRIEDSSGAAIPGTNITVTSLETGVARTVTADDAGNYLVLSLPVGRYEVRAEKTGFKTALQTGINLVVGQQAVVILKLEVGAVQEQVTVTSDAPLINTTTSSIAGLVGEQQVKELPLNGRSFDLLLELNPGTVNITAGKAAGPSNAGAGGNLFSVAGRRNIENLTLMNGVEYSGAGNASVSPDGASGFLLGVEAVREYNVVTDTYGAEYGQRAGAHVNVVTQSGTNQLHGSMFEFLRNSDMDARNFFDPGSVPPLKRNQFGVSLGGPIRKDKIFIFGNYEGYRQRLGATTQSVVPDSNARQGLLPCGGSGFPTCGNGQPTGTPTVVPNLDTRMLPFLQDQWPAPNGRNLGGGVAIANDAPGEPVQQDFGTMRFDQIFSAKDSLNGAYTIDDGYHQYPAGDPLFAYGVTIRNQVTSLQETHIVSPQMINTSTVGYTRAYYLNLNTPLMSFPANQSFVTGFPPGSISIGSINSLAGSGITASGNQNPFALFVRNLFTATDGVQLVKGRHQISAGAWFQRIQQNDDDPLRGTGIATFTNIESILQGTVATFQIAPRTVEDGWRSWLGAWYVQDSIKLRPNLTVRVGLRQEFSGGWSEVNGIAQTNLFIQGVIQTLPRVSDSLNTQNNSKWLFAPRIGLAWDVFGSGKTSVRAAFGTYYDLVDSLLYLVDTTPPLNGAANSSNVSLFSVIPINPLSPIPPPCSPGVPTSQCNTYQPSSMQSNYQVPTLESWNLTVEQQLTRSMALRVAYLGYHAYHEWVTIDPNTIAAQICSNAAGCLAGGINAAHSTVPQGAEYVPVEPTRPNPFLSSGSLAETFGYGNFNSLQVEVIRRFAQGLQFRANYTWAKSMDVGSGASGGAPGKGVQALVTSYTQEYAKSAFSVNAQASANLSYELPIGQGKPWLGGMHGMANKLVSGWQVNSIVSLRSGLPANFTIGGTNFSGNGDLQGDDRPNLAPGFSTNPTSGLTAGCAGVPAGQQLQTPNRWFDPCAFLMPASGTFGNVGRMTSIGPGLADVTFSLFKTTKISERIGLQFRAEVFNAFNHANFIGGGGSIFSGSAISASAGILTAPTATTSRQIQLGLKLIF